MNPISPFPRKPLDSALGIEEPKSVGSTLWGWYVTSVKLGYRFLRWTPLFGPVSRGIENVIDTASTFATRWQTLHSDGGLSALSALATAGGLTVADDLGAGNAIQAAADVHAGDLSGFTTSEKRWAYGEAIVSVVLLPLAIEGGTRALPYLRRGIGRLRAPRADAFNPGRAAPNINAGNRWTTVARPEYAAGRAAEGATVSTGKAAAAEFGDPRSKAAYDYVQNRLLFAEPPTTLLQAHERGHQWMRKLLGNSANAYTSTFSGPEREYFADLFAKRMAEYLGEANPQQLAAIEKHMQLQLAQIASPGRVRLVKAYSEKMMHLALDDGSLFR